MNANANVKEIKVINDFGKMFAASELWVVNTSDKNGSQPRGDIILTIKDENSEDMVISLPSTWLPMDLCAYTDISNYKKSTNFRNYIRGGLLSVIEADTAKNLLSLAPAKDEMIRVRDAIANMRNANIANLSTGTVNLAMNNTSPTVTAEADRDLANDTADGRTPKSIAIMEELNATPPSNFHSIQDKLIDFLLGATIDEIRAVAAGLNSATNRGFAFIDRAIEAYDKKEAISRDVLSAVKIEETSADAVIFRTS